MSLKRGPAVQVLLQEKNQLLYGKDAFGKANSTHLAGNLFESAECRSCPRMPAATGFFCLSQSQLSPCREWLMQLPRMDLTRRDSFSSRHSSWEAVVGRQLVSPEGESVVYKEIFFCMLAFESGNVLLELKRKKPWLHARSKEKDKRGEKDGNRHRKLFYLSQGYSKHINGHLNPGRRDNSLMFYRTGKKSGYAIAPLCFRDCLSTFQATGCPMPGGGQLNNKRNKGGGT